MTGEERGLASYYITGRDGLNYSRHTRIHTNNSRNIYSSAENGNIAKHCQSGIFQTVRVERLLGAILGVLLFRSD